MRRYIGDQIRALVFERAGFRCEYCKVREDDSFLSFEIDHIISLKHGGSNEPDNLAMACPHCNASKGTDLATFVEDYEDIVPIFNPRLQIWESHFQTSDGMILPLTKIGQATIKLLQMNHPDRLIQRSLLAIAIRWP